MKGFFLFNNFNMDNLNKNSLGANKSAPLRSCLIRNYFSPLPPLSLPSHVYRKITFLLAIIDIIMDFLQGNPSYVIWSRNPSPLIISCLTYVALSSRALVTISNEHCVAHNSCAKIMMVRPQKNNGRCFYHMTWIGMIARPRGTFIQIACHL